MLDIKFIRNNPEMIKQALKKRKENIDIDALISIDENRREILREAEQLKNKKNTVSQQIAQFKKQGKDARDIISEMRRVSSQIKKCDQELRDLQTKINYMLLRIPNIPHPSVPYGETEADNQEIRKWGQPTIFDFVPKPHWELGENLGILDAATAAKVTGSRFTFYKGMGARLERALINFMLDVHTTKHGYTEILPPYMVHRDSMQGTGQLPKFEQDAFRVADTDYFLIPTAEVPVTNMHRDEILDGNNLPLYYVAYSACFRSEAGSAGRDTRGLIRQHQFNKVELVKFVKPQDSYDEHEKLTADAEEILKLLKLPYRVVNICIGDLGFTATKKYDIEVWLPSYNRYVEISSCSNFEDFQARRANIRYKQDVRGKADFVHTLNGSGVAVGRAVAAILENCQQSDGSILIPEKLRPYMGGLDRIEN
ncbi:MAG: serine--tRNA ligase [Clostridia bacterium]|nr:serine--tRNA ligase [Clostridia bacterium]